ncbi:hypothetical protein QJ527_09000 [Enterococcus mundtii]|uniref:hypothetical protein n=1 Tax=Enterococcus TaxID=1350 RepID=UPI000450DA90|nr:MULTISPECIES: hypothetical protein [Enterococcus]EYT94729.1 hypothetical protein AK89_12345 [Enterococcus mundtii CRL35]MDA9429477.1 hypothetical protein [Enterococcus mundtii 1A]MDK4211668.1 hypothetical protein [Enterococcus mundtii]MDO7879944.1 hypothetical protein [Enterococcus mundtii]MEC3941183.1 hypothetical protein [Enterococcus mundtii]
MNKYDGEFSILGMVAGIIIGSAFGQLPMGIFLGVIIGIAMDWAANLWNDRHEK